MDFDTAIILDKLVPQAKYGGSLSANDEHSYNDLRWEDERNKPAWQELIDYYNNNALELLKEEIRPERNRLLDETDRYMVADRPITEEQKSELIVYRKALRDLPESITFENSNFPEKPCFI